MKIALLSNVTIEVLAGMLREEHAVWTPTGFGAWMETALNPPEELIAFSPDLICLLIDRHKGAYDGAVQNVIVARHELRKRFPRAAVILPDLARLAADAGEAFYDEKMWRLGKMPFSLRGLAVLKKICSRKKVAVVDLDNTLWSGVVGEDGVAGIVPDVALQTRLKDLKNRGILLVALSKNNPEDVEPVWSDPRMVLQKSDFVARAFDWQDKATNLTRIAAELNVGLDSFVFVDDSPVERAQMRAALPEVTVADFPPQLEVFFPFDGTLTEEDARKTEAYQAEACRRDFAAGLDSFEEYLKGLAITTTVRLACADDVARLAQLSQKTNQFNVCTNRYSEEDVARFLDEATRMCFAVSARDRFGDYGLIAFVQVCLQGADAEIIDWVMSCRAMNRRIEFTVEAEVERQLALRGVRQVTASWRQTGKNAPVRELYDLFGFTRLVETNDLRRYQKTLV